MSDGLSDKQDGACTHIQTNTHAYTVWWCVRQRGVSPVSGSCSSELESTHKGFCVVPESCSFFHVLWHKHEIESRSLNCFLGHTCFVNAHTLVTIHLKAQQGCLFSVYLLLLSLQTMTSSSSSSSY